MRKFVFCVISAALFAAPSVSFSQNKKDVVYLTCEATNTHSGNKKIWFAEIYEADKAIKFDGTVYTQTGNIEPPEDERDPANYLNKIKSFSDSEIVFSSTGINKQTGEPMFRTRVSVINRFTGAYEPTLGEGHWKDGACKKVDPKNKLF